MILILFCFRVSMHFNGHNANLVGNWLLCMCVTSFTFNTLCRQMEKQEGNQLGEIIFLCWLSITTRVLQCYPWQVHQSPCMVTIFNSSPRNSGRGALESTWNIQPHYINIYLVFQGKYALPPCMKFILEV